MKGELVRRVDWEEHCYRIVAVEDHEGLQAGKAAYQEVRPREEIERGVKGADTRLRLCVMEKYLRK